MAVITAPAVISGLRPAGPPPCRSSSRSVLIMTVVHNPFDSRIWFRQIDALLSAAGWTLQDYDRYNPSVVIFRKLLLRGGSRFGLAFLDGDQVPIWGR